MEELLDRLEKQIRELTGQQQQSQQNEPVLARMNAEKALLLSKQQKAINQIEALISRLKTIEKAT